MTCFYRPRVRRAHTRFPHASFRVTIRFPIPRHRSRCIISNAPGARRREANLKLSQVQIDLAGFRWCLLLLLLLILIIHAELILADFRVERAPLIHVLVYPPGKHFAFACLSRVDLLMHIFQKL